MLRGGDAPIEMLVRHAQCLDRAGLSEKAVEAYDAVRLRDPGRSDVAARVTALRRELEAITEAPPTVVTATVAAASPTGSDS